MPFYLVCWCLLCLLLKAVEKYYYLISVKYKEYAVDVAVVLYPYFKKSIAYRFYKLGR